MQIPGFTPNQNNTPLNQIDGAEKLLGIQFPDLYREVLVYYNGSYGGADFDIDGGFGSIGLWLSIDPRAAETIWSRLQNWSEHDLSPLVIPFAEDGGGNYVCFDYRGVPNKPSIKFWFHEVSGEDGLYPIAEGFGEFLNLLYVNA